MSNFDDKYDFLTYYIDSVNRAVGESSSDFYYWFWNIPELCDVCHVWEIQVPKSYYLINKYNNILYTLYDDTFYNVV